MKYYLLIFLFFMGITFLLSTSFDKSPPDPRIIPVTTKQPEEGVIYPVAIIGSGAAGTMAAKRAILNNNEVLLFTGAKQEQRRSRGNWVRKIDNIPGLEKYERAILELRNDTLEDLIKSPLGQNLYVIKDSVLSIEKTNEFFKITDGSNRTILARYVVMATGIMDEQPHIQGSIRPILKYANGQTVVYCLVCDGHRSYGKKSVVIGYSEAAGNAALILAEKYQLTDLAILTNGFPHQFNDALLKRIEEKGIKILEAPIQKILGNEDLKQLKGFELETGENIEAEFALVSLGIRPNNQLAIQMGAEVDVNGLVMTDTNGETCIPDLFIIGDLRSNSMKQIYTAWQQAVECMQLINKRIRMSQ